MAEDRTAGTTPAAEPKRRRGLFAFLFKSVLGCCAFALGCLIALILLLPTLLSGWAGSFVSDGFAAKFKGSLEIGEVDLAWFNPQTISGLILRDPQKVEVVRASLTLPSLLDLLRSGGVRIGHVVVAVDANLVAGDDGVTNLQRALEPTRASTSDEEEAASESTDPVDWLARLDADAAIQSQHLSWSDAETRRVGIPFEVRDLAAALEARPGQPLRLHASGKIVSESPGQLEIDATLHGPIDTSKPWPYGKIDAKGRIEGFSSAMIDGIAGLKGNLKEVLGPRFDVRFDASGVTPSEGELSFELSAEKSSLKLVGRFEGGALHSGSEPFLVASLSEPRGFITEYIAPHLPAGSKLVFGDDHSPWSVRIDKLDLPIPSATARDMKSLQPFLDRATCDLAVALPGAIGFENEITRAAGGKPPVLRGTSVRASITPKKPVDVVFATEADAGEKSAIRVAASLHDAWASLAAGESPHADVETHIQGLSTRVIEAIAARGTELEKGLGARISLDLVATDVSAETGSFDLGLASDHLKVAFQGAIEKGVLRGGADKGFSLALEPPEGWIDARLAAFVPSGLQMSIAAGVVKIELQELVLPLPLPLPPQSPSSNRPQPTGGRPSTADPLAFLRNALALHMSVQLPPLRVSNDATRAAKIPLVLSGLSIDVRLAADGHLTLGVASAIDTGAKGKLSIDATCAEVWRFTEPDALKNAAPIDAKIVVDGLATAGLDALAAQNGRILEALGPKLALTIDAKNATMRSGEIAFEAASPNLELSFKGKLDQGALRCTGADDLHVSAVLPSALLTRELAPALPAGTEIAWPGAKSPLKLRVSEISLPIPDFGAAAPAAAPSPVVGLLEKLACHVALELPHTGYSNEALRAAKIAMALDGLVLTADVAPGKALTLTLVSAINAGGKSSLDARVALADPWFALRDPNAKLPPVDAQVKLAGIPTATLDALAGKKGVLSKLLGGEIAVDLTAQEAGLDRGSILLEAQSPTSRLRLSAKLGEGALVCSGEDGLDLSIRLPPGWLEDQVSPLLPAGARLSLPADSSPIEMQVRDVRLPFVSARPASTPTSTPDSTVPAGKMPGAGAAEDSTKSMLAMISKLALTLKLTVPSLTYADAQTDAAKQPVTIEDLRCAIEMKPSSPPSARIQARIQAETPGELSAEVRALDPLETLTGAEAMKRCRVSVDVHASKVPTALVDVLARQGGLLVEALGPRVEIKVKSDAISLAQGAFTADLTSDLHAVHCQGAMQEDALVITRVDGLTARIGLGPVVNQKVVGNLVPLLVNVKKPEGAPSASVAVDALHMPLSGDLSKLDAIVRIDLGEVTYSLLPGLDSYLGAFTESKSTRIAPLRVPIEKGVASYEGLALKIGGQLVTFKGTFNLVDQSFKMGTEIPLKSLGKSVNAKLDSVRQFLSPDLAVPIEIRGTWKSPKVRIGEDFMKKVVEDALAHEAGNLLDGLLKKKKKD